MDLKSDSVMPNAYKVTKLNEEQKSPRDESSRKAQNNRSNQLKQMYDKQREINKQKSERDANCKIMRYFLLKQKQFLLFIVTKMNSGKISKNKENDDSDE